MEVRRLNQEEQAGLVGEVGDWFATFQPHSAACHISARDWIARWTGGKAQTATLQQVLFAFFTLQSYDQENRGLFMRFRDTQIVKGIVRFEILDVT